MGTLGVAVAIGLDALAHQSMPSQQGEHMIQKANTRIDTGLTVSNIYILTHHFRGSTGRRTDGFFARQLPQRQSTKSPKAAVNIGVLCTIPRARELQCGQNIVAHIRRRRGASRVVAPWILSRDSNRFASVHHHDRHRRSFVWSKFRPQNCRWALQTRR